MALLITEAANEISVINEAKEDGTKNTYIEGIFLMGDIKNRNGRIYRMPVLERAVNEYTEKFINTNRGYGELQHPSTVAINLDRVAILTESLRLDGTNYIGKAKVTNTDCGRIVKGLLGDGANLGVSSRGMGTIKESNGIMEVQNDFMLATAADVVADPSAPSAFVRGIMENVEWIYDIVEGCWKKEELLENTKKYLHKQSVQTINENSIHIFEQFLNKLSRK